MKHSVAQKRRGCFLSDGALVKSIVVFGGCVLGLLSVESVAETASQNDETFRVVVTGSRIPVEDIPQKGNVHIITREDIKRQNPRSVTQLLQGVSGLHVENAGARGSVGAVYLRGAESNYTLVLIDGISVNDPTNSRGGAFDFSLLDVNSIEQIEIVKGPASSVYGSAAMAGVINIVTHGNWEKPKTILKAEMGSHGLASVSASTGLLSDKAEVSLRASYEDAGEQVDGNEYTAKMASVSGVLDFSAVTEMSFSARYQDASAEAFPEASGGDQLAVLRELDQRDSQHQQLAISLKHQLEGERHVQVDVSYSQMEEDFSSPGVDAFVPINESESDYERQNTSFQYRFQPMKTLRASVGAAIEKEKGDSRGEIDFGGFVMPTQFKLERDVYAVFAEGEYRFGENIVASVGARADKPDELDSEISPHVGVSYTRDKTQYQLTWGKGFKLPSFFALAHPLVGNPNFGSESNENVDVTVLHALTAQTTLEATAFHSQYFDLIDFGDSGVLVSRDEVVIKGVELSASSKLSKDMSVNAHFSALNMDIKNSDAMLHKRPKRSGGMRVNWAATSRANVSMGATYVGKVQDFSYPTGEKSLDAHTRVDASLQWRFREGLDGLLAVDNLLNKNYDESIGSQAAGTVLRVGLQGTI